MKSSKKISLIISGLLIVAMLAVGAFAILGTDNNSDTNQEKDSTQEQQVNVAVVDADGEVESSYDIKFKDDETVLDLLNRLTKEEDFTFELESFDFGDFVTVVNGIKADSTKEFWALKINDQDSMVGVSEAEVTAGDKIELVLTAFY